MARNGILFVPCISVLCLKTYCLATEIQECNSYANICWQDGIKSGQWKYLPIPVQKLATFGSTHGQYCRTTPAYPRKLCFCIYNACSSEINGRTPCAQKVHRSRVTGMLPDSSAGFGGSG